MKKIVCVITQGWDEVIPTARGLEYHVWDNNFQGLVFSHLVNDEDKLTEDELEDTRLDDFEYVNRFKV